MNRMMIDIETLDTAVTAQVTQVAWVIDEAGVTRSHQHWNVTPVHGRTESQDTLKWWLEQDVKPYDPNQPYISADDLASLLANQMEDVEEVWANPPHFDIAILNDLLRPHGYEVPHRKARCLRTLVAHTGTARIDAAIPHNPLSDCYAQIETLRAVG